MAELRERIISALNNGYRASHSVDRELSESDLLFLFGSVRSVLLHSLLLFPEFEVLENEVVLANIGVLTEGKLAAIRKAKDDQNSAPSRMGLIEKFNWIEVSQLFSEHRATEFELNLLAELICQFWSLKLAGEFPDRKFLVRVVPASETGGDVGVAFREVLG